MTPGVAIFKNRAEIALTLAILCLLGSVRADVIEITDVQGRSMQVRLVACDGTIVRVSREADQRIVTIPLTNLDAASRQRIEAWKEEGGSLMEKYEITVATGRNTRKDGTEDFDDKRFNLHPVVTVRNPDTSFRARGATVTVLFLGRPIRDRSDIYVIGREHFDLKELGPLGSATFRMEPLSMAYDNRGYAQFGARYLGYAVFIHDGDTVLDSTSVPVSLVNAYGGALLKLEGRRNYDRFLKEKRPSAPIPVR